MTNPLFPAIFGLLGIIIGGFINGWLSHRHSRIQFKRDSRHNDYNAFIDATAAIAVTNEGSKERADALALLIGAKAKILLNSSTDVVERLVAYGKHKLLSSDDSHRDFSLLLNAMRNEIGDRKAEDITEKVMQVLFPKSR
jgi:hypothetical protein